jgi:hypothetical protein
MGLSAKKKIKQNQGAAMIVTIVVGVVLMAFALSLLLLAYSLAASVTGRTIETQCKELAKSVNRELEAELMTADYDNYEQQCADFGNKNNLWFYLRYNLWQDEVWPYYNDLEAGHDVEDTYRYFRLDAQNTEEYGAMADSILITMYWEIDSDQPSEEDDKSFTVLHIRTEVQKGDYAYAIDSAYALTVTSYAENEDIDDIGDGDTEALENASVNPYHRSIYKNEKWVWTPN